MACLFKPHFLNQLQAIPANQIRHILKKIEVLETDPLPSGNLKKKLHNYKGDVYRIRSGNYRILYSFKAGIVSLLGVDQRKDVYRGTQLIDSDDGFTDDELDFILDSALEIVPETPKVHDPIVQIQNKYTEKLPHLIDNKLLSALGVPQEFWEPLRLCSTVDELCRVNIPELVRNKLFDAIVSPDYDQVLQEPDLITAETEDLLRYIRGEVTGFLLRLSPEQEKLAYWSLNASGPTLLKGGPGTGKTTIALYRVKAVIEADRVKGVRIPGRNERPRILFTTYTNALVTYCEQQLRQLLGVDFDCVTVRTADSVVREVVNHAHEEWRPAHESVERHALRKAMERVLASQGQEQLAALSSVSHDYLLEEFGGVIEAREISNLEDYLAVTRSGRVVGLRPSQRKLVWALYEEFCHELGRLHHSTWRQLRRRAVDIVRSSTSIEQYNAVIIDEAQDLDPTVLRLLVGLSKSPKRVFIAADANQSICGSSFRWSDVHEDLKFRGRTATVSINHRSTREIGDAAHSYLQSGVLDKIDVEHDYSRCGSKPCVWTVQSADEEAKVLSTYLSQSLRTNRIGLGSCAILTPTHASGQAIAERLRVLGIPARFMVSKDLDLEQPVVKVLPLKTSKGLEFPVVAVAGYVERSINDDVAQAEEKEERMGFARRTLFVAMTRAMRDLLVVRPSLMAPPELDGFDQHYWQLRNYA